MTQDGHLPISQESIAAVRSGDAAPGTLPNLLTCDEELAASGFRLRNSNFPIEALDEYRAQLVPDWFFSAQNGPVPNSKALIALLENRSPIGSWRGSDERRSSQTQSLHLIRV